MPKIWFAGFRASGILCAVWCAGFQGSVVLHADDAGNGKMEKPAVIEARLSEKSHATAQLEMLGFPATGEAFIRTIASKHRPLIDLYLAAGIDPNARDAEGHTPLLAATLSHDWDLAAKLLSAGADPKKADNRGMTPLMAAAGAGHVATFKALRDHGADVQAADEDGRTACHYAIAAHQTALVKEILDSGIPLPGRIRDGRDATALAFESTDRSMIELVLSHQTGQVPWNTHARIAFLQALEKPDMEYGKLLLSKFTGSPAADDDSQPLLAYAVAQDDRAKLQALLDCGADPNVILDKPGDAVFHDVLPGNFVRYYVQKEPGMTVLNVAAGLKRLECIRILLDHGANKNLATTGKSHFYALYFASWAESPEALQILLGNAPNRDSTRIEVSLSNQRATFIKDGVKVLSSEISTGKEGFDTKSGEYVITDKHLEHHSTLYHNASMPYFMRLSFQAFGLHEGYVTGRPASHGCIRLPGDIARRLFKEAPIGTWVSIYR